MKSALISPTLIEELQDAARIIPGAPLSDYTTFKTGGPADVLVFPRGPEQVSAVLKIVRESATPCIVIGGGSNLLVSDSGVRGIVMRLCDDDASAVIEESAGGMVYVDASVKKSRFIDFCINRGYGGVEFMAGIPGVMGGGIVMNAGTTMGNFASIAAEIDCVTEQGDPVTIPMSEDMASYRKLALPGNSVVIGARCRMLREDDPSRLKKLVDEVILDREAKHPLDYPSAGSVFKNPPGHASWQLIQNAGLKGRRVGGAMISEKHTNFIINAGGATSGDIKNLIDLVRETVFMTAGVELEPEVRMIGSFKP
jgi:UDP-N-acetylmuramate dehydrogenase